jgi:HrpA-like RNA helicase
MDTPDPPDFLNAKGVRPNFLTGTPYSDAYKDLAKSWSTLPIYADRAKVQEIVESIRSNAVTLLVSATGSGKSVFVPKFALKLVQTLEPGTKQKVAMTIPKRMAVQSAATFSAKQLNVSLGNEVDFGFRGKAAARNAKLLYLTDGILLSKVLHGDVLLRDYSIVILDEAHERPVPTDILLYFLRDIVRQRPEFRVVIMSATIDPQPYIDYFKPVAKANVIHASGTTSHPIRQIFLNGQPKTPKDALSVAVDNVLNIVRNTPAGADILVFVPRIKDTLTGCTMLRERGGALVGKTVCVALNSGTEADDMELATSKSKYRDLGWTRRVIFATNIAESSVTIDGLQYVLDTGLEVQVTWDPTAHATRIAVDFTSQGQIKQRIGRVGRTGPGIAYHLYSQALYDALPALPKPNIAKIDLTDQFLLMCSHFSVQDVVATFANLLTPPSMPQVTDAMAFLHFNGLIQLDTPYERIPYATIASFQQLQKYRGAISPTGTMLLQAQDISPSNALLLFWGSVFGCVSDMILLACILETTGGELTALWSKNGLSASQLRKVAHKSSDHITLINVYKDLFLKGQKNGLSSQWAKIHSKINRFYKVNVDADVRSALLGTLKMDGMDAVTNALLAARSFHLSQVQGKTMTNLYPLRKTTGHVDSPFGRKLQGAWAVYESLTVTAQGPTFGLVTEFPTLKKAFRPTLGSRRS